MTPSASSSLAAGIPLILACSPRRGGNTDTAADLLAETLKTRFGAVPVQRVAALPVRPCISCGWCNTRPGTCSLDSASPPDGAPDQALSLLRALCAAPAACLVSPLYFCHFPAQAKALIDRAQSFWTMPAGRKPGAGRSFGVVLLAARPRGDQLFAGALLTLRYMAEALGMVPAEPLLLRGLDEASALRRNPDAQAQIQNYGLRLAAY